MKRTLLKIAMPVLLAASAFTMSACSTSGETPTSSAPSEQEIALGSSVLGNWDYRNADGGDKTEEGYAVEVYVDTETKFHFTVTAYYEDFAPSVLTFEGQITSVEQGLAHCFPVFMSAYLDHGAVTETATAAAQEQYSTYRNGLADLYEGQQEFQITFHRLSNDEMDNGYITIDNADMDISFGVFTAVLNASQA